MNRQIVIILIFIQISCIAFGQAYKFKLGMSDYYGDYLGLQPPDTTPVKFAPDFISKDNFEDMIIAISNDGNQMIFMRTDIGYKNWQLLYLRQINGRWTRPERLNFPESMLGANPIFSESGDKIFFTVVKNKIYTYGYIQIFDSTYSKLIDLGNPYGTENNCFSYYMDRDSVFYFSGKLAEFIGGNTDIYASRLIDGKWIPSNIKTVNDKNDNDSPFISPNMEYMVFNQANSPNAYDSSTVMLSFRNIDNTWDKPINLSEKIGGLKNNWRPIITNDKKYLFMSMQGENGFDIYWVSTKVIDKLKNEITSANTR